MLITSNATWQLMTDQDIDSWMPIVGYDDESQHMIMDDDRKLQIMANSFSQQVIRHGRWLIFIDHDDIKRMTTPHHGSRYLTMYIGNRSKAWSRAKTFGDWILKLHGFLTQRPPGSCPLEKTCGPNDLLPTLQGNSNGYIQIKTHIRSGLDLNLELN